MCIHFFWQFHSIHIKFIESYVFWRDHWCRQTCIVAFSWSYFIVWLQGNHISCDNGRVHCSLNINTETGRLSARRPNLQVLIHSITVLCWNCWSLFLFFGLLFRIVACNSYEWGAICLLPWFRSLFCLKL